MAKMKHEAPLGTPETLYGFWPIEAVTRESNWLEAP
jgi:hypothetical protein